MVVGIQKRSAYRLCRSLARAFDDLVDCHASTGAIGGRVAASVRVGQSWFDWRTHDMGQADRAERQTVAERSDDSTHPGVPRTDPSRGGGDQNGLLPLVAGVGCQCGAGHRHHYQAYPRWCGNSELPHARPVHAVGLSDPVPRQDQCNNLCSSAQGLGEARAAVPSSVRQRRVVLRRPYPLARHRSGSATVPVLRRGSVLHSHLRSQTQPSDRDVSWTVVSGLLDPPDLHRSGARSCPNTGLYAVVSSPLPTSVFARQNALTDALWPQGPETACRVASTDPGLPGRAFATHRWTLPLHAQSRPLGSYRISQRAMAGWLEVDRRVCARHNQHGQTDTYLLAQGFRPGRLAGDQKSSLSGQGTSP